MTIGQRFAYIFMAAFLSSNKRERIFKQPIKHYLVLESRETEIGVMITLSHNDKVHNGFKLYQNGMQI